MKIFAETGWDTTPIDLPSDCRVVFKWGRKEIAVEVENGDFGAVQVSSRGFLSDRLSVEPRVANVVKVRVVR